MRARAISKASGLNDGAGLVAAAGRMHPGRSERPTRERIVASAERLFAERGFDRVSMPAIARASGVTAGAIYKHFASKADLLFEVVKRAVVAVPAFTAPEGDAAVVPRQVATFCERERRPLRELSLEVHSVSRRNSKVRRVLRQSLELNYQQIRRTIEPAQRAGKISPRLDAELLAIAIITFMMGLAHMETIAPQLVGDPRWRDFVKDRVAAMLGMERQHPAIDSRDEST